LSSFGIFTKSTFVILTKAILLMDKLIQNFSIKSITDFFATKISSFSPNSENLDYILKDADFTLFSDLQKIGEVEFNNSDELIVFTCKFQGVLSERSSKKRQFEIAKKILKEDFKDGAIFIFYDENDCFRFSFIRKNYGNKEQKFTNWKRYTYFVDPVRTNKTFKNRINGCNFSSLEEIQEAFSVEKLNKKFYEEIATAFYSLIGGKVSINKKEVSFDAKLQLPSTPVENRKVYQEFAVRLIGRTIFCWFLKNKKSDSGVPLIPEEWLSSNRVASVNNDQHNYYHSILEKLFFLVLNKKHEDRKPYVLPNNHEFVPFLNGGLFEAQDDDFFPKDSKGIHSQNFALNIPNQWFRDFFETLEQYNFTIDENSINDFEVSIDPEMLGTIFENLLAEIDPDTEKSARKSTGSFYTPREIVDYMVEQSLLQYIKTKTNIEDEEQLEMLLNDDTENPFNEKQTITILEALSEVKILDPACGSGAFPMGVLHKIIGLLKKLDKNAVWWKAKQLEKIDNALVRKTMETKLNQANSDYIRKLGVIQHSIYGVDIQPIAAEISKLRSFLSLIIDENIDDNHPDGNRGIEPLPNLEFKFVTANTLIGLEAEKQQTTFDFGDNVEILKELQKIRNEYLQATPRDKEQIKKRFRKVQDKINSTGNTNNLSKRENQLYHWNPFSNEDCKWFDPEWMFGVEKFDIVIGNPPYRIVKKSNTSDEILNVYKNYKTADFKINLYALFYELSIKLGKVNSVVSLIIPDTSLNLSAFTKLRQYILNKSYLRSITFYEESVFENATVGKSVILNVIVGQNPQNFDFIRFFSYELKKSDKIEIDLVMNDLDKKFTVTTGNKFENNLINKLKSVKQVINDYYDIYDGINPGSDFTKNQFISQVKKGVHSKKIIDGKDFDRYTNINWEKNYIEYSEIKVDEIRNLLKKEGKDFTARIIKRINFFEVDKVITRQTADCLIGTFDNQKFYLKNSIHSTIIKYRYKNNLSNYYILALYNSNLLNWFYKKISLEDGRVFPQVKIERLRKLPFILPQTTDLKKIDELVIKILNCNSDDSLLSSSDSDDFRFKIDIMVYKLYELTYDEVLVVEPEFGLSKQEYDNYKLE
jgi:hypothetical protein